MSRVQIMVAKSDTFSAKYQGKYGQSNPTVNNFKCKKGP